MCHYCGENIHYDDMIHMKKCLRCRNFYHKACFGEIVTSVTCGHCTSVKLSNESTQNQRAVFMQNLDRAHLELNHSNQTMESSMTNLQDVSMGIPSTSTFDFTNPKQSPPKCFDDTIANITFINEQKVNFGKFELTPDTIEALELLVEAQTIPIVLQLNDIKKELALLKMTLNSLVEEVADLRDEQHSECSTQN